MKGARPGSGMIPRDDRLLEKHITDKGISVRAPRGFSQRVMEAVYRESLVGRQGTVAEKRHAHTVPVVSRLDPSRVYRRLGISFMLTAAVLAMSLLFPRGAYTTLINSGGEGAALGAVPSAVVQGALTGAGQAVLGALGERQIGGTPK